MWPPEMRQAVALVGRGVRDLHSPAGTRPPRSPWAASCLKERRLSTKVEDPDFEAPQAWTRVASCLLPLCTGGGERAATLAGC